MGWMRNTILKYLQINDTVKSAVKKEVKDTKMELGIYGENLLQKYYQEYNSVLFTGDASLIEEFVKERSKPCTMGEDTQSFWRTVDKSVMKIHYPLASSISRTMANVLFGDELSFRADTGNKEKSKKMSERLQSIYKENDYRELFQKGSMLESYSGSLGAPIVIDTDFTDHPIIQWYPAEQIDLKTKYGKIYEVIFNNSYEADNHEYTLKTVCGHGYIAYELYDDKKREVPLDMVPEVADLKDIAIVDTKGKPIKALMAVFKPNKTVSATTVDMPYGASDYEGLYGIFDSLDEIVSAWSDTYRNSRIVTFTSEDNLKRDPKTGDVLPINKFGINTLVLYDSNPTAGKETRHERSIPDIDVSAYKEGFENYIKVALQKVGLSPITMGLLDSISRLSSSESLAEREKVTLKTWQEKSKLWKEFLVRLSRLLLLFDDMKDMVPVERNGAKIYTITDTYDYDFLIDFPQYAFPSREEQLRNGVLAMSNRLVDLDTILNELYGDEYDKDYIAKMKENILKENENVAKKPVLTTIPPKITL